jgi:GH24 family phage-related lysozyme (muramidase)
MASRKRKAAIAAAAMVSLTSAWEGERLHPYRDASPSHKWTVCRGETNVKMQTYTHAQCLLFLEGDAKNVYLPAVAKRLPGIENEPYRWAAFGDFAYNVKNWQNSKPVRLYAAGHKDAACRAMAEYKYAGRKVLPGLYFRRVGDKTRIGEIQLCLTPYNGDDS